MPTYEIVTKTAPALTIASVREVVPQIAGVSARFGVIFQALNQWLRETLSQRELYRGRY